MKALRRWWRAVVLIVLLPFGGALHAEDVVKLHVPSIVHEKDDLLVQIRLTRNADNQFMKVVAASSGYYGSSEMQLDGQSTSPITTVRFRSLPAGWYEVTGAVYDGQYHMRGSARVSVLVYPYGAN
jgi:hypothetical protein